MKATETRNYYSSPLGPKTRLKSKVIQMKLYFIIPLLLQKLIWIPTRFSLKFFTHLKIEGLENLDGLKGPDGQKTNYIFAANHASEADPFLLPASLPFFSRFSPIFYVTREQSFYDQSSWRQIIYGETFFRAWGGYTVYVGLNDYAKSLTNHERILRDGGSLFVFPEGRRTYDGKIQPAKRGIAYLSEKTAKDIVPVAITGTFSLTLKDFLLLRRSVILKIGKPITLKELEVAGERVKGNDVKAVLERYRVQAEVVMGRIEKMAGI